jgi:alpha-methylacyl-CoA racemase
VIIIPARCYGSPVLPPSGPLTGIRVVELAGLGPAPYACMLLAELGADVVRVDRPGGGAKLFPPEKEALHRSRPCAAVDLKKPEGRDVVLRMVEAADVLVEGLRPGVTERLGLGPDDCLARNPRLVYARMTGWGQTGPLADRAGHDINYLGLTGALHAIGPADKPIPPLNIGADFGGGSMFLVVGVLAALLERATSGRGQVVDAAMVDGASSLITMVHGMLGAGLWRDRRASNLLDGGAPFYDTYETSDGKYVAVGAIEMRFWGDLVKVLELDPAELPLHVDKTQWPKLREIVAAAIGKHTRDELVARAEGTDACLTPVLAPEEAAGHPHNAARGTFVEIGGMVQPAPAPRFDRTPPATPEAPRAKGSDTEAVLAELGVTDLGALREAGVIA